MSHSEKPSEQQDETETEIHEDDKLHPEDCNGKDDQVRDSLKTSQTEKRSVSPLTLFKEDLSQFKEGLLKVFKDKDTNPKTTQPPEKPISTLTLLKEDLNNLKEDISSIFRIGLSKEHEDKDAAAKLDSSNAVKIKATKAERSDESLLNLFKRGNLSKITPKTNDSQEVRKTLSSKAEEQTDDGFTNKNTISTKETNNNTTERPNKLEANVSQEVTERRKASSETQQSQEVMHASEKVDQLSENGKGGHDSSGEEEEEDEPLMSRLTLIAVGNTDRADLKELPGGHLWALKNFAYYLTLDPNTANSEILLTDSNRKATRVWSEHQYSEHPERFEFCPQVLCREGLLDKVYWEVEWRGGADIGVTYNNISRDGDTVNCLLGHNERSWTLECAEGSYTPCHNRKRLKSLSPENFTHRIGIYLNWPAGALSFYCVSQDMMVHLHTFSCTFTEPLYPGFWVWAYNGSVSLCHVELEWEHALK